MDCGAVQLPVMFLRVYFAVSLVLVIEASAASENFTDHILHRSRRQTPGNLCPPLKTLNTIIVTCTIGNEEVSCDKNVKPGTIVRAKCKRFYKPTFKPDYSRLTCLSNGKWDKPLFHCTPECGSTNLFTQNRIVDGIEAHVGSFPWHAGMYYRKDNMGTVTWEQKCSGSLITEQFVLTVAHCVTDVVESDLRVALGKYYRDWDKTEETEAKRTVSRIICQPDFSKKTFSFDVALLRLNEKVQFGEYIMPVCRGFPSGSTYLENKDLYVVGWGLTKEGDPESASNTLQYNSVVVVSQDICRKNAPSVYPTFDKFCTVKGIQKLVSIVQAGDSGGGITSVYDGLHFILGAVSAKSNGYSIFTNITWPYNVIWIESEMRIYNPSFRWDKNELEIQSNERGCLLPEASSSRKFCSLAAGCEKCDIHDHLCFIPPGSYEYRVRVVCAPGYTLRSPYNGGDVAMCLNGQWYPGFPECHRYQYIPGDPWVKVTWEEARDKCMEKGYLLATIKSEDEDKNFKEAVAKQFNATGDPPFNVWIGLTDVRIENTFEWVDGSILSGSDFSTWVPGEPNNNDYMEQCVHAGAGCGHNDTAFNWNDGYCTDLFYYFCKEIILSGSTAHRISGVFGKKNSSPLPRYKYIPGNPWSKVTWEEARDNCLAKGSQLAVVTSDYEQRLFEEAVAKQLNDTGTNVLGTLASSIWIGLMYDKDTNASIPIFKWVDGTIHSIYRTSCFHSNWLPGEPNNMGRENCVAAIQNENTVINSIFSSGYESSYKWNDADCKTEYYYFCSVKL